MFAIVGTQIVKMAILMLCGFLVRRGGLMDHRANQSLSNLLLFLINPMAILYSFLTVEYSQERLLGWFLTMGLTFVSLSVSILIGRLVLHRISGEAYTVEQYSSIYSNCVFIGMPMVSSVVGEEGVYYLSAYVAAFNVLCWTHGLSLMTGKKSSVREFLKRMCSPALIAVAAGFVLFLSRISLPDTILDPIHMLSNTNTPLAMLVAGGVLAETKIYKALRIPRTYLVLALRLIVAPLLLFPLMRWLSVPEPIMLTIITAAACPPAANCMMFAMNYGQDYRRASELFTLGTMASFITIPVIVTLASMLLT